MIRYFGAAILLLGFAYISFGIPLACGWYGCIRNTDLMRQRTYNSAFARSTNSIVSSDQATLTTLMRRYALAHTSVPYSITPADAARYRTDVLHTTDVAAAKQLGFSSLQEYDQFVLIPFLTQEALMKARNIDNASALYKELAQEQPIFLFTQKYRWDRQTGEVVAK